GTEGGTPRARGRRRNENRFSANRPACTPSPARARCGSSVQKIVSPGRRMLGGSPALRLPAPNPPSSERDCSGAARCFPRNQTCREASKKSPGTRCDGRLGRQLCVRALDFPHRFLLVAALLFPEGASGRQG